MIWRFFFFKTKLENLKKLANFVKFQSISIFSWPPLRRSEGPLPTTTAKSTKKSLYDYLN